MAFAAWESVHARNFKTILSDLGAEVQVMPEPEDATSTTKENLKYAATREMREIDREYPQFWSISDRKRTKLLFGISAMRGRRRSTPGT